VGVSFLLVVAVMPAAIIASLFRVVRCLMVAEEGVATPEDVDEMSRIFTSPRIPPFRLMDRVGLDVVLNIEEHYADVRGDKGFPEGPRKLLREYIDRGRLGVKSGSGFYDEAGGEA
jgi:3-hydroxybutyryl-CoA dehydrogenase